ncbi:TNT domain-containing protein [Saccharomonospora azurea]
MGIELPPELAAMAEVTGVSWPEADEDALREQAEVWRRAARELTALAGDADACAERALGAMSGGAAEAARRRWATLGDADSGLLAEAVRGATRAADRLDHAAEQVGRAKVEIVRQLVAAANTRDAAVVAADAGHPAALLGVDTVLRGAARELGMVTEGLVDAVGSPEAVGQPLSTASESVDDLAGAPGRLGEDGLGEPLDGVRALAEFGGDPGADGSDGSDGSGDPSSHGLVAAEGLGAVAAQLGGDVGEVVGGVGADGVSEDARDGADADPGGNVSPGVVPEDVLASEDTGPIALTQLPTPPRGQVFPGVGADAPTPPSGTAFRPPEVAAGPATGHTHLSGLAPSVAANPMPHPGMPGPNPVPNPMQNPGVHVAPQPMPGPNPVAQPAPFAPPAAWGPQHAQRPPVPPVPGGQQGAFGAVPPGYNTAAPQGRAPAAAPGAPQAPGAAWNAPYPGHPPPASSGGAGHAPPARPPAAPPPGPPAANPPGPPGPAQPSAPHPGAAAVAVGAPRQERESVVALFVVHMFPIGHLPVASDRPARQLPVPTGHGECGVARFEPHDHPESHLVDAEEALAALRCGGRRPAPPPAEVLPSVPPALLDGHEPFGELSEAEWNRRYLVRDGDRPEYAWPPPESYPEGGHEAGEPVVLDEGTVLDRFGDAHGRVFAADGTPFAQRSLPPDHLDGGYRRYRVVTPLPVWRAISAPWFGQPGGGVRYRTVYSAAELVVLGHLADITFEERA